MAFNICIKELVRQVSVQCVERGRVLKKVFSAYLGLVEILNVDYREKRKRIKKDYAEKLDKYVVA